MRRQLKRRNRGKQPNGKQRQNQAKAKAAGQQQPGMQDGVTVLVRRDGTGDDAAGGYCAGPLDQSIGSARATSRRHQTNFSERDRPHHRCERAPTRGRPSAGSRGF